MGVWRSMLNGWVERWRDWVGVHEGGTGAESEGGGGGGDV